MTKRTCSKCGGQTFDKGRLVMSDEVIRFETKGKKDPRISAYVCRGCGSVELTIEQKERTTSLHMSIDAAIFDYLYEKYWVKQRTTFQERGSVEEVPLKVLAKSIGLSLIDMNNELPAYLKSKEKEALDLRGWGKASVSLNEKKDTLLVKHY